MSWEAAVDPLHRALERRQYQVGWVGEQAGQAAERAPGQQAQRWANDVSRQPAQGDVRRRFDWRRKGRDEVDHRIVGAMNSCQKPYHLWNCERPEVRHTYSLDRIPPLRFGQNFDAEERGMPVRVQTSTRTLARWIADEAFEELVLRKNRERDRALFRQPLPFGKSDEERSLSEPINLLAPPGGFSLGGPPAPGVPAGGFSLGGPSGPPSGPPGAPPPPWEREATPAPATGGFSLGGAPPGAPPPPPWERDPAPPLQADEIELPPPPPLQADEIDLPPPPPTPGQE